MACIRHYILWLVVFFSNYSSLHKNKTSRKIAKSMLWNIHLCCTIYFLILRKSINKILILTFYPKLGWKIFCYTLSLYQSTSFHVIISRTLPKKEINQIYCLDDSSSLFMSRYISCRLLRLNFLWSMIKSSFYVICALNLPFTCFSFYNLHI